MILSELSEQRLMEAERDAEKYRSMFENAVEGIFQTTMDGHYITCNPALARLYKYNSPAELVAHHTNIQNTLYIDPNKRAEFVHLIRKNGFVNDFQAQVRCKDGSVIWISENAREVRGADGQFLYYEGFVVDISERKKAESIVRESEMRLRALVGSIDELVFEFEPDGRILNLWATNDSLLVLPRHEMVGRRIGDLLDPSFINPFLAAFKRISETGHSETIEYALKVMSGERWFIARISPIPHPDGITKTICMSARDITERKKLEESRTRYATILEAAPDFVGSIALNGCMLYLNKGGRTLVGVGEEVDISNRAMASFHPRWANELLRTTGIPTAIREGSWLGETALLAHDGREIPVSQLILAHRAPTGEVAFISTICRDLTERKLLEEQLRQSHKMEAIGQLAGGVAHDFNNLLTVVMGYSELLLDRLPKGSEFRHPAEVIRRTGEHAAALTQQLLAFSRRQVVKQQNVNVNAVVSEIQKMLRRLIREDIQLTTTLAQDVGMVWADPSHIEQILINLVVNARDAITGRGTIAIETSVIELKESGNRQLKLGKGKYVVVSVSDNGIGMSREVQARIFEPFFTTKEKGKGTGLGLATVYGAVKQSEGEIEVVSEPGRGTVFKIYLPRIAGVSRSPGIENLALDTGGDERILVVEDDPEVRRVTCSFLESDGYRVYEAGDFYTAQKICENAAVDLLLTDVVLSGENGADLALRLKRSNPALRVVFMSGHVEGNPLVSENVFVQKPFSQAVLTRKVREVLNSTALQHIE